MFKKLVSIDNTGLSEAVRNELQTYAIDVVFFDDDPLSEEEIISRASGADALLVSWRTVISKKIIDALPELSYIGMCCSLIDETSANVDIAHTNTKNIIVKGVKDYGDEGVIEFIFSELIRLFHGFGEHSWSLIQEELTDKTIGIIGFGTLGQMLAERAVTFGMKVFYYSRTRKLELETDLIQYKSLDELVRYSDIISTHLPKGTVILNENELMRTKERAVLINTSLQPTFDRLAFNKWIEAPHHYAVFDGGGLGSSANELLAIKRVLGTKKVSGFTAQASNRLSIKVLENIKTMVLGMD